MPFLNVAIPTTEKRKFIVLSSMPGNDYLGPKRPAIISDPIDLSTQKKKKFQENCIEIL